MKMIDNAYDKIPPPEVGVTSMEQYHKEIEGTHDMYYSAMKLLCGIKCLCKYGRMLDEVYTGSVVFRLHCPNMDALFDLWQVYTLGDLQKELQNSFVTDELLNKFGCTAIKLKVHIKREEYLECKHDLGEYFKQHSHHQMHPTRSLSLYTMIIIVTTTLIAP